MTLLTQPSHPSCYPSRAQSTQQPGWRLAMRAPRQDGGTRAGADMRRVTHRIFSTHMAAGQNTLRFFSSCGMAPRDAAAASKRELNLIDKPPASVSCSISRAPLLRLRRVFGHDSVSEAQHGHVVALAAHVALRGVPAV